MRAFTPLGHCFALWFVSSGKPITLLMVSTFLFSPSKVSVFTSSFLLGFREEVPARVRVLQFLSLICGSPDCSHPSPASPSSSSSRLTVCCLPRCPCLVLWPAFQAGQGYCSFSDGPWYPTACCASESLLLPVGCLFPAFTALPTLLIWAISTQPWKFSSALGSFRSLP